MFPTIKLAAFPLEEPEKKLDYNANRKYNRSNVQETYRIRKEIPHI